MCVAVELITLGEYTSGCEWSTLLSNQDTACVAEKKPRSAQELIHFNVRTPTVGGGRYLIGLIKEYSL